MLALVWNNIAKILVFVFFHKLTRYIYLFFSLFVLFYFSVFCYLFFLWTIKKYMSDETFLSRIEIISTEKLFQTLFLLILEWSR